jgi:uncharacterized protein (TIGR03435 family)
MRDGFGRGFGVGLLLIAGAVLGQTGVGTPPQAAANKLAFVSATVKPSVRSNLTSQGTTFDIQTGNIEQIKNNYGFPQSVRFGVSQLQYGNMPFIDLIAMAYNVKLDQISGPGWMNDVLFDVEATLPPGASKDEISAMLQNLLQDRFKLVIHRVTKNQPVLALVVAKGGPKLQPATANPQPILTNKWGDSTVRSNNMSMTGLADLLSNLFQGAAGQQGPWQEVVDQTGLTGQYQVSFITSKSYVTVRAQMQGMSVYSAGGGRIYEPQNPHDVDTDVSAIPPPPDPLIFESIQKLGLKLEKSKAPVEMLVVDHAEKDPTAN